jgi:methyl-accepting chemotaxis protein
MIAAQTHDIATNTEEIAEIIVEDANKKEFRGKHEVKAKVMDSKKPSQTSNKTVTPVKKEVKVEKATASKTTPIKSDVQDDEWESF